MTTLKTANPLLFFPEGTRNKGEGVQDFHAGSFKFAEKTGCKIIPMVQTNTDCIFERQFPRLKATHTTLAFGKPIDINSFPKEERKKIAAYTHDVIVEMYEKE